MIVKEYCRVKTIHHKEPLSDFCSTLMGSFLWPYAKLAFKKANKSLRSAEKADARLCEVYHHSGLLLVAWSDAEREEE